MVQQWTKRLSFSKLKSPKGRGRKPSPLVMEYTFTAGIKIQMLVYPGQEEPYPVVSKVGDIKGSESAIIALGSTVQDDSISYKLYHSDYPDRNFEEIPKELIYGDYSGHIPQDPDHRFWDWVQWWGYTGDKRYLRIIVEDFFNSIYVLLILGNQLSAPTFFEPD